MSHNPQFTLAIHRVGIGKCEGCNATRVELVAVRADMHPETPIETDYVNGSHPPLCRRCLGPLSIWGYAIPYQDEEHS